jgi:hypothetical protein
LRSVAAMHGFSRKGAEAQRANGASVAEFFAPLRLCVRNVR